MAEKKVKVRRRDIRKQRWTAVIAALLAIAMAVSAIAAYSGRLLDRGDGDAADPGEKIDLDAYREYYASEIERLEKYIEEIGPTAPVLGELVEHYAVLIQLEGDNSKVSEETVQGYRDKLIKISRDLVELEPDKAAHRLRLLEYYNKFGEEETVIAGEIDVLCGLLHENPDPASSLMLIGFIKSTERLEDLDDEIAWLKEYLEQLDASGELDSENRYYYAYLLGEFLEKKQSAEKQLALIMEKESEESPEYLAAERYLDYLQQEEETGSEEDS